MPGFGIAGYKLVALTSTTVGRRRVFADDVLQCPCGGRRSVIAVVADPALARTLLTTLGLPNEPATFATARDPPQVELAWDEAS